MSDTAGISATERIELSLFSSRVAAICEEMGALLGRVAFSPNIRDRLDYSCALFDHQGQLLGQATHIPVHLGSMAHAMRGLVEQFDWQAGDMVLFNDPFRGGTHLPDVTFVCPVFVAGRLIGFCANRAHHADIGSEAPGSMPLSTSLEEEGIIIPPTLITAAGVPVQSVLKDLLGHLQDPACGRGDLQAQVAANLLGEKRLRELAVLTGMERWRMVCDQLQSYGRSLAMASLEAIPHGRYTYRDYLDDDGLGETDIPICVTVDVGTGGITVDFEGTSPQVKGNLNCPLSVTAAAVFYVFRCLMPDHVPACHGAMEPVRILAPEPCLVNAAAPAAVAAGNVETSMRITDAVAGALAAAMPRQIPAASQGSMNNLAMGARGHHRWDYYETLGGGMGAGPDCAGRSATHSHMTNTLNTPVEVLERHYPLRILRYEVRRQSGGIGRFSGGDGVVREYEFLGDAELSILSERRRLAPWGLQGGAPGRRGSNRLDGVEIGGKCQLSVYGGQRLLIETPGGGGFGTPPG